MRTAVVLLLLLLAGCVGSADLNGPHDGGGASGGGSASGGGIGSTGGGIGSTGGGSSTGGGIGAGGGGTTSTGGGSSATGGGGGSAAGGGSATGGGTADPCVGFSCGADSHCAGPAAHCVCDNGFFPDAGACHAADPGNPAQRTQQQVCDAWTAGHVVTDPSPFSGTSATCDPGVLSDGGFDDTMTRLNMFRWLVGLGPTSHDAADDADDQACALIAAWNPVGPQAHSPPPTSTCYTAAGASGAGSSNIAWGSGSPSQAIDQWIEDNGNFTTFGHRRWLLNPPLDPVGFGYYFGGNNYGSAACIRVFNGSGSGPHPNFYAWPPPGFSPSQAATWEWTVHGSALGSNLAATITQMSDGGVLGVTVNSLPSGYGEDSYYLQRNGWSPVVGETYLVHLSGTGMTDIDYPVSPVSCP